MQSIQSTYTVRIGLYERLGSRRVVVLVATLLIGSAAAPSLWPDSSGRLSHV